MFQRDSKLVGTIAIIAIWLFVAPFLAFLLSMFIPNLSYAQNQIVRTVIGIILSIISSIVAIKRFRKNGLLQSAKAATWTSWIIAIPYILIVTPVLIAFIADWKYE